MGRLAILCLKGEHMGSRLVILLHGGWGNAGLDTSEFTPVVSDLESWGYEHHVVAYPVIMQVSDLAVARDAVRQIVNRFQSDQSVDEIVILGSSLGGNLGFSSIANNLFSKLKGIVAMSSPLHHGPKCRIPHAEEQGRSWFDICGLPDDVLGSFPPILLTNAGEGREFNPVCQPRRLRRRIRAITGDIDRCRLYLVDHGHGAAHWNQARERIHQFLRDQVQAI